MADGEVYHIEPQASFVTSRHHIYRESDSLLPAGKCGKLNNAFCVFLVCGIVVFLHGAETWSVTVTLSRMIDALDNR